jgi:hypothetical protein
MKQIIFNKIIFSGSIIFLLFLSIGNLKAQDSTQFKKNEVWANFFGPGFTYKRSLNTKTFLSAGLSFNFDIGRSAQNRDGYYYGDSPNKYANSNENISFYLGIEKRATLFPKLTLFLGPEISYGLSGRHSKNRNKDDQNFTNTNQSSHTFGAGYTIGGIYNFNNYLGLSIRWSPKIYYRYNKSEYSYHHTDSQHNNTEHTKENNVGIQLYSPDVSLILKF